MEKMPLVPVSWGEVIDKVTILEIKEQRISGEAALRNVKNELSALRAILDAQAGMGADVAGLTDQLRAVNRSLWDLEDGIRLKERQSAFDAEFIRMARAIYFENDRRAAIKREINRATGSALVEEKSYDE